MLIKICGVGDPEIARFAAGAGAHFIGCVLTPNLARSVTFTQANEIAQAARAGGAEPVALFVGASKGEIEEVCHMLDISIVQAYELSSDLDPRFRRFYINEPKALLRKETDFLLIESEKPGSGKQIDITTFSPPEQKPWFIAGGLTPQNVREMILRFRPDGVDVSSGVEKKGQKDRSLIEQFIEQARLA